MFREMRRKRQALSLEKSIEILERGTSGVLALAGDDGYPYAVPLSFVYDSNNLYFHCAKSGHKLDAIKNSCKASFCVIDQDKIVPERYTTYFRSVIIFGKIHILEDEAEKHSAIEALALKYAPTDSEAMRHKEIDKNYNLLCMLKLQVEHITGKEAVELTQHK